MHVIVSGTASGIGLAIAKKFLDAGHSVTGFDLCRSAIDHPRYRHVAADIRSASAEGIEPAEILINNAGTLEEQDAIEVNLTGTIRFTERFKDSPALRSVLFIASASGRSGMLSARISCTKCRYRG